MPLCLFCTECAGVDRSQMQMKEFDITRISLEGTHLVEANAGTGKTYALSGLFLRLILEKDCSPGEILVVTYTRAATQELRDRIAQMLRQAIAYISKSAPVPRSVESVLRRQRDPDHARETLIRALRDLDEAAIFTIHGFCQRFLEENAFETGSLFDTELLTNEEALDEEIVDDFWRNHICTAEPELVDYLFSQKWDIKRFFQSLSAGLRHPYIRIIPTAKDHPGLPALKDYRKTIEALRKQWPEARAAVGSLLMDPGIKGNIYGVVGKGRPSPRQLKVAVIVAAMDQFLAMDRPLFPPIPEIEKLSADKLAASMRKGYPPPVHQIFSSCARLWQQKNLLMEEMGKKLTFLKRDLFHYILKERTERKGKRNVRGYQDLLMDSFSALKQKGSERVLTAVRARYRAALIDEFQDTDPIQFRIFDGIFGKGNVPLFYIGDPKQAIYGFRGADVVTYMEAARAVPETATLRMNWRSEPNLVEAVNNLFSGIDRPFVYPEIGYTPSAAAEERRSRPLRMTGGAGAPLRMCLLRHPRGEDSSSPLAKKKAWPSILKFVAREVARLVDLGRSRKALLGDEPLSERHIAVLVRKNSEARMVQECLREVKIPSVLYNAGNIFETVEAREIGVILQAIAEPRNEDHMRAALTTDTMGVEGAEMETLSLQESGWEHRMLDFREYHRIWEEQGFIPLFRRLLAREKVRQRLLAFSDGERRLTNILHLGELLHGAALEERLGMKGLVTWLFRRIEDRLNGGDEQLLKLETDEEAVKIVTIHKSKGLEYPVVFCPSLWDGGQRRGEDIIYHDPDNNRQLTLDLGSEGKERYKRVAEDEELSENLRLLYVALTRAQHRCYVVWGWIKDAEKSPLAYILHRSHCDGENTLSEHSKQASRILGGEQIEKDLFRLEKNSKGTIAVETLQTAAWPLSEKPSKKASSLFGRDFGRSLQRDWKITSFSSLSSGHKVEADLPDYDASFPGEPSEKTEEPEPERESAVDMFAFPKGARAGTCLHDILERVDFMAAHHPDARNLIAEKLHSYGFEEKWVDTVHELVQRVLAVPLHPGEPDLVLRNIGPKDRLHELEFLYPVKRITPNSLEKCFRVHGGPHLADGVPEEMGRLVFSPVKGFLKGFIDLVFHWKGKFYLVDWKSNFLGHRIQDYGPDGLRTAMAEGHYVLQYHLYVLALDRYLKMRSPGYRYEDFFGGIFYLFLRGMDPVRGSDFGIFRDKPSPALVAAMGEMLIG